MQTPDERTEPGTTEPGNTERPAITRTVDIDAGIEEVWEAVSTDAGRSRWIESDPDRVLIVEDEQPPTHISWWWWSSEEAASRVEVRVVAIPDGTRVIVTETAPASLPLASMVAALHSALAVA